MTYKYETILYRFGMEMFPKTLYLCALCRRLCEWKIDKSFCAYSMHLITFISVRRNEKLKTD